MFNKLSKYETDMGDSVCPIFRIHWEEAYMFAVKVYVQKSISKYETDMDHSACPLFRIHGEYM